MTEPRVDPSPRISDEIRQTTCYMCACRCGINVHLKDGEVAYIEGNRDHPVNRGVLCAKGAAGIMQHKAPSRLRAPLKRVGPRGSGQFEEITWEEALETAVSWLKPLRDGGRRKSWLSSPGATSRRVSPAGGHSSSARRTSPRTVASAR
jgi:anaerobic selenocysteine-containing dehydrogenase